ncbi:MAG: four-carbon acid sugar kinase family protein [Prevotella sp.]|nr:four-carbon acid sugar kinase family protein [Prevotella sp.]
MIIVIADDITGAAEVAGIAFHYGLQTRLQTDVCRGFFVCDVLVIATDTRSMGAEEAGRETRRVAKSLMEWAKNEGFRLQKDLFLFKKTDSALRGHVVTELEVLLAETGYRRALWLPGNPSKGRTIENGAYFIDGIPLHQTDFSFDPEFPAKTAQLKERFPELQKWTNSDGMGVFYTDSSSLKDVSNAAETISNDTLPAGAADFFRAFLLKNGHPKAVASHDDCKAKITKLILCGSTQSKPLSIGVAVFEMPTDVYEGRTPAEQWAEELLPDYERERSAILTFGNNAHRTGKEAAVYLRHAMAGVAASLIRRQTPEELIVEGGATAFCLLQKLGWNTFQITREIAPGVVRMRAENGTFVTMKPGSYAWGDIFQTNL